MAIPACCGMAVFMSFLGCKKKFPYYIFTFIASGFIIRRKRGDNMPRYQIIITTKDDRRLHYRTDNETFLQFMHDCATKALNVQLAQQLSIDELFVTDTYLDHPISCEVIDHQTKTSRLFPI